MQVSSKAKKWMVGALTGLMLGASMGINYHLSNRVDVDTFEVQGTITKVGQAGNNPENVFYGIQALGINYSTMGGFLIPSQRKHSQVKSQGEFIVLPSEDQRNFKENDNISVHGGLERLAVNNIVEEQDLENRFMTKPHIEKIGSKTSLAKK